MRPPGTTSVFIELLKLSTAGNSGGAWNGLPQPIMDVVGDTAPR
jgi:hypothetical protein